MGNAAIQPIAGAKTTTRALTSAEIEHLLQWCELDFLTLDIHAELEHQIRLCMKGVESAVVIGARGLGKSKSVQRLCDKVEQEELERALAPDTTYTPRGILRYDSSRATGTKTALLDLWAQASDGVPSAGMQKRSSPHIIIGEIVRTLQLRSISLVCIDEAQMIAPDNLDLLRQVPDAARAQNYPLGMLLVGSEELRQSLVSIQQLGQRFTAELRFVPLTSEQWTQNWSSFHPHLAELKATLPPSEWKALTHEMFSATRGKFRRIEKVLLNANELALIWKRPVDPEILRFALDKLAAEN